MLPGLVLRQRWQWLQGTLMALSAISRQGLPLIALHSQLRPKLSCRLFLSLKEKNGAMCYSKVTLRSALTPCALFQTLPIGLYSSPSLAFYLWFSVLFPFLLLGLTDLVILQRMQLQDVPFCLALLFSILRISFLRIQLLFVWKDIPPCSHVFAFIELKFINKKKKKKLKQ